MMAERVSSMSGVPAALLVSAEPLLFAAHGGWMVFGGWRSGWGWLGSAWVVARIGGSTTRFQKKKGTFLFCFVW